MDVNSDMVMKLVELKMENPKKYGEYIKAVKEVIIDLLSTLSELKM